MRPPSKDSGPLFRWQPAGPTYLGRVLMDQAQWRAQRKAAARSICPVCGQMTVDRIKSLGPLQVRALAVLHGLCLCEPDGWVHRGRVAERMPKRAELGGELARLRFWGFTLHHPDKRGWWQTTDQATAFLTGRIKVPAKIALAEWKQAGKFLGFFGPWVSVGDVMKGADFDLDEVLASSRPSLVMHATP